jgi:predicted dehydrogenase
MLINTRTSHASSFDTPSGIERGDRVILHTDQYQTFVPEPPGNTFVMELQGFVEAVRQNAPPPISAASGFTATALIEAIWQSGKQAHPVEVEQF